MKWTNEEDNILFNNYKILKIEELGHLLPTKSISAIKQHLWAAQHYLGYKPNREYNVSTLLSDTPETYYWIGFLLADGHFSKTSRLKFALAKQDQIHVQLFSNFIEGKIPIRFEKRCVSISAQNKDVLPLICEKFDINNTKTYNPPSIKIFENMSDNLFLSLLIGYIDGDGCIRYQSNRKDCTLHLKAHASWKNIYQYFETQIYKISNFNKRNNKHLTKINNQGYCSTVYSDNRILKFLKNKTIELNLPVMKRKWDKIDLNFKSKCEIVDERLVIIHNLLKQNYTITEISKKLNTSYATTYGLVNRKRNF